MGQGLWTWLQVRKQRPTAGRAWDSRAGLSLTSASFLGARVPFQPWRLISFQIVETGWIKLSSCFQLCLKTQRVESNRSDIRMCPVEHLGTGQMSLEPHGVS